MIDSVANLASSKTIGYSEQIERVSKTKRKTTKTSVEIQAWEIAALIAAVGVYEFASGNPLSTLLTELLHPAQPTYPEYPGGGSNTSIQSGYFYNQYTALPSTPFTRGRFGIY